jgi:Fur family transcriptional regulator, ferric uptake regulator
MVPVSREEEGIGASEGSGLVAASGTAQLRTVGFDRWSSVSSQDGEGPVVVADDLAQGRRERSTRQKRAIATALGESDAFRSAQDLHAAIRAKGENVGLTTIYNQLHLLVDLGQVDSITGDDGETRYRLCTTSHHHHLVCRDCGRTVEVDGPQVERWAERVAEDNGFTDVTHVLEIFGTCTSCVVGSRER